MAGTGGVLMGTNHAGVHTDGPLGAFVPIGATAQLVEQPLPSSVH